MKTPLMAVFAAFALPASADVVASSADHYTLRLETVSELSPEEMWARLTQPDKWWHPEHTYSGSAHHLSLQPEAGGVWVERWNANSVAHGTVLAVLEGEMLRLDAPFGPLQGMGVEVVWTITLDAGEETGGTRIIFDEVANGSSQSGLDKIAPAVNAVKQQAIDRLADPSLTG